MDLYLSAQADHFLKRARTFFLLFYMRAFPVSSCADLFSSTSKVGGGKGYYGPPSEKSEGAMAPGPGPLLNGAAFA